MQTLIDHINEGTITGKFVLTAALIVGSALIGTLVGRVWSRRTDDRYRKFYIRKGARYVTGLIGAIAIGLIWRPFAGQLGLVVGLVSAGVAFGLQGPIGAFAGGLNIISSSVFRVGDRVQFGGVSGDVINLTPTRTTIMEIGSSQDGISWVHGRQYTGRIVSVPNNQAFIAPSYNFSATFDFTWEEVMFPIAYWDDWRQASRIMTEEAVNISASDEAQRTLQEMVERYPIARTESDASVYLQATDNYIEMAARFVVPIRQARQYNHDYTQRVLDRFEKAGISVASTTSDVTVLSRPAPGHASG